MLTLSELVRLCCPPRGGLGPWFSRNLNKYHSALPDWGLPHLAIQLAGALLLENGWGGGCTLIQKLAAAFAQGKICGIDHSEASVAASLKLNAPAVARDRVKTWTDR